MAPLDADGVVALTTEQQLAQSRARLKTYASLFDWYLQLCARMLRTQMRVECCNFEHEDPDLEVEIDDFLRIVRQVTFKPQVIAELQDDGPAPVETVTA
jgi:hypothetical protein